MRNNCGNCIRQGRSRLKHLESHVVFIRDCLHSVYLIYDNFLLRLPVGRGGVINSPRSVFLCFYFFFGVQSWATAHG